jgi:NADH:ubiquinone oxidoreductase subunit E
MPLETEARAEIRGLIADLQPNDGKLLTALHRIQHRYGYISREAMEVAAEQLELFPAQVYGAASYYQEYRFEPPARTTIRWCTGPACRLRNGNGIRDAMLATLGLAEVGEQTEDRKAEVVFGQCNGTCEQAPMVWVEDHAEHTRHVFGKLTAAEAVRLARTIRDGERLEGGHETVF